MGSVIRFPLRTARLLLGDDEQSVLAYFRNTTLRRWRYVRQDRRTTPGGSLIYALQLALSSSRPVCLVIARSGELMLNGLRLITQPRGDVAQPGRRGIDQTVSRISFCTIAGSS